MRAYSMDALQEWFDSAVESFERHCSEEVEAVDDMPAIDQGLDTVGAHELCAIEESQSFFRFELDGTPTELREHIFTLDATALEEDFTLSDEGEE